MRVDDSPSRETREADVRHRDERHAGDVAHPRQRRQRGMRPGSVVRSDGGDVEPGKPLGGLGRTHAAGGIAVLVEGHQGDDRQRGLGAHGLDGGHQLVEVEERLDHEEVDAATLEYLRLLRVERRVVRDVEGLELAERADRPRDEDVPSRDLARLPCEAHTCGVDRLEVVLEEVGGELAPVGAERVRLDQLRAGPDEARVQRDHALGGAQVRLLGAAQPRHGARDDRAHAAVRHDHGACAEPLQEAIHGASVGEPGEAETSTQNE